jgi:aspartate racemase
MDSNVISLRPRVGVIGGAGHAAANRLASMICGNGQTDLDHIDVVTWNIATPAITEFGLEDFEMWERHLDDSARILTGLGCRPLVVACISGHIDTDVVREHAGADGLVDLVEVTAQHVADVYGSSARIGVLASQSTADAGLWEGAMFGAGFDGDVVVDPVASYPLIRSVLNGHIDNVSFSRVIDGFYREGCEAVIAGCTEVSFYCPDPADGYIGTAVPLVDPLRLGALTARSMVEQSFDVAEMRF